jgi:Fanconi-associated nuclease 1
VTVCVSLETNKFLTFLSVHSEGSAVRVLYGILFWDIIFAPVPGAFETPFQSAPLDLAEETFIYARENLVAQRLKELEEVKGTARTLVEKIDDEHRHKNTMCVGVRWNKWSKEDLVDIVEV